MPQINPLLQKTHLPQFNKIKSQHIKPAITQLLKHNRATLSTLLKQSKFTWENLMTPISVMHEELAFVWSTIKHLHAVVNSTKLRKAYTATSPKISKYFTQLKHNAKLYQAIKSLQPHRQLNKIQRKILRDWVRDFRLSGIALKPLEKKRLLALQNKLVTLTTKFANNVLDATGAWHYLASTHEIAGIPPNDLALAKERARRVKKDGWLFTLDAPSYCAVVTYAKTRTLRQKLYTAYISRASELDNAKYNNNKIIDEILAARLQLAKLLKFPNYAALALATKMLTKPQMILTFLNRLAHAANTKARNEYKELTNFAQKLGGIKKLQPWDIVYYSEKLREQQYQISQEMLRAYFPINHVLRSMFLIAQHLFGISVSEQKEFARWHKDVRLFRIYAQSKKLRGEVYMDLYARKNKQSGAWAEPCRSRMRVRTSSVQTPVAYLNCNFTPPLRQQALLTHDEVVTLFHEFGHCLHHLLTQVDYPETSGINGVPSDAVELPSQFMENWCWEKASLKLLTKHYKNHRALSEALCQKLAASQKFQAGLKMLRQLEFALFDLILHIKFKPHLKNQVIKVLSNVRHKVRIIPTSPQDRFPHSFSHIFADDYAAGYYSYKWSEVMAADAFAPFKTKGIFNKELGEKFLHTILEPGGSIDPLELFVSFRGRKPQVKALLKHCGLI